MGWKEWFGVASDPVIEAAANSYQVAIASPFAPATTLNSVVWPDIMGSDYLPLTRTEAVSVPTVSRSRLLIAGTIARLPLEARRDDELADNQPVWLTRTDGAMSPYHRMLWTVDDLIFYGWSLWAVTRDTQGRITRADRINYDRWSFDVAGRIEVDGELVRSDSVVLIPGPHEGLITFGARTIRQASNLLQSADKAAKNQTAYLELHQTNEASLTDDDIAELVNSWAKARTGVNGGVAFTNNGIEVREHGAPNEHLLIEGRNASAVDIARCMGIPAALIDAQAQQGSLTYETTQDRNAQFLTFGLSPYMDAISGRLSQDDVAPRKTVIQFSLQDFIGDVKLPIKDQQSRSEEPSAAEPETAPTLDQEAGNE
ncbi:phage portal protein [Gordonia sp. CPCC 206044]|uniref:phage portal protein n=1 Tax=Gordonia sp. CPCC 206044 TaxID=3140793 RepID=UPI003AF3CB64